MTSATVNETTVNETTVNETTVNETTGNETTAGRTVPADDRGLGHWSAALERNLRPADGWVAFCLLALNLMVVVLSVERADWVATPNLVGVLLMAMVAALLLYRLPLWSALSLPLGIGLGLAVITWQMSSFKFDGEELGGSDQLWERLNLWFQAARHGAISIDQTPFAFGLMLAAWLTGFLAAWSFLRHRNFWGVFILGGIGLFSNLTFLPPSIGFYLGSYLFTALLLVARVQAVRRQDAWRRRNIRYDENLGILNLSDSFFLAIAVLFVAFLLPTWGQWSPTNDAYQAMRQPLQSFEGDFNRLFAGLPARRALGFRIWDDVMAFQGTINPATTQVLAVESPVPIYWKGRTYGTYTSKGWVSDNTVFEPLGHTPQFTNGQEDQRRMEATYTVTPLYGSKIIFSGDRVTGANRDVSIETHPPQLYELDLTRPDGGGGLPAPLASLTLRLHEAVAANGGGLEDSDLESLLPADFRAVDVVRDGDSPVALTLEEALPPLADTLSVQSNQGRVKRGQSYEVTSAVSVATPEELRGSGSEYPVWIWAMYTQLPDTLPQRVRDLAVELTSGQKTPYDQAKAVEGYLKTLPYNLNVDPPPFNGDGVDHFLFDQQQGYSEYFASSMAVLMRSVGVPSRLAAGYTTGDEVAPGGVYAVTDSHSHAWVELYMPGYGWVPFEPTPGAKLPVIGEGGLDDPTFGSDLGPTALSEPFDGTCFDEFEGCDEEDIFLPDSQAADDSGGFRGAVRGNWVWWLVALVGAAVIARLASWEWDRTMAAPTSPGNAFRRLTKLSNLSGLGPLAHQTPYQFAQQVGHALPEHRGRVSLLVDSYVREEYGNQRLSRQEERDLELAWRRLRYPLLRRAFRWWNR